MMLDTSTPHHGLLLCPAQFCIPSRQVWILWLKVLSLGIKSSELLACSTRSLLQSLACSVRSSLRPSAEKHAIEQSACVCQTISRSNITGKQKQVWLRRHWCRGGFCKDIVLSCGPKCQRSTGGTHASPRQPAFGGLGFPSHHQWASSRGSLAAAASFLSRHCVQRETQASECYVCWVSCEPLSSGGMDTEQDDIRGCSSDPSGIGWDGIFGEGFITGRRNQQDLVLSDSRDETIFFGG
mmetsp:Transcript_14499/g.22509  ORF Transcript_14499/g.22509 Transcript_14499/m.22509 type:complete len:239 (+) Transcript_14499:209-925(+)